MSFKYQISDSPSSPRPQCLRASSPASLRRCVASSLIPAFSLVEVLFAVMILGIGFIMVAAIFPVGIQQGRDAIDETTGRTIARAAANRAAAAFHCINDSVNLAKLDLLSKTPSLHYLPLDPTVSYPLMVPPTTVTNPANAKTGTVGSGVLSLYQLAGSDWKYMGEDQYLSQLFFRTTYTGSLTNTGTLSILALAMRDGRAAADQGTPLAVPYVRQCQILTDGKANIYSDLYVQYTGPNPAMSDADIAAFLGTSGTIVTADGAITRMQDSPSMKGSTPPAGKTWADDGVTAWMFSSDIPVIGSYTLTTSLP